MSERKKNAIPKPTNFGNNLRLNRKIRGLSQTALAEQVGVKRNNIASYESGMVEPNARVFLKICHFFDQSPEDMLGNVMEDKPLSSVVEISDDLGVVDQVLVNQMDQFIAQTNDMAKIYDGYKNFIALREEDDLEVSNENLNSTLIDLLELLNKLLKSNWKLIESISPIESS